MPLDQRHLDGGVEFAALEGLDQVAQRRGRAGAGKGRLVGVGRQVDHGDAEAFAQFAGDFHAVAATAQVDVHERDVGAQGRRPGLPAGSRIGTLEHG